MTKTYTTESYTTEYSLNDNSSELVLSQYGFVQTWAGRMPRALVTVIAGWMILVAFRVCALAANAEAKTS